MRPLLAWLLLAWSASAVLADPLPRVTDADWPAVRARAVKLIAFLDRSDGALPADTAREVRALLGDERADGEAALVRLQELLDPLCLVGVHINPESRVKAARGPRAATLSRDRPKFVLVRIHNEGGVTAPLAVGGQELLTAKQTGPGRWLEADIAGPLPGRLGGEKLEYMVLRLTAREDGKREATLEFDAGQGTQDLGFRAQVPVLFRVAPR